MKCKLTTTQILDVLGIDQATASNELIMSLVVAFRVGWEQGSKEEYAKGYNDGAKDTIRETDHPSVEVYEDEY